MSDDDTIQDDEPVIDPGLQAEADQVLAEIETPTPIAAGDDEPTAERADVPMDQAIHSLLDVTFNGLLASWRGDHWRAPDDLLKTSSQAYAAVIAKYWPDATLGVEVAAILITAALIGPRVAAERVIRTAKAVDEGVTTLDDAPEVGAAGDDVYEGSDAHGVHTL